MSNQDTATNLPNILWFIMEDTSPRFGCYGDALARTPNIDRLAAGGTRFTHAFSTAGVCAPSRAAIFTGLYQTSFGAHHMRTTHVNEHVPELPTPYEAVPPHYVKVFSEYLRARGYFCSNNHKTDYQFKSPVTAWDENGPRAHWRHRAPGEPFFAVFNASGTHESKMWPREGEPLATDPDQVTVPPYLRDGSETREALARHYDNIAESDAILGQLLSELDEDGLADNTIVFLLSDHGEGLPRAKRWPYDAGIRVPLIVRWPAGMASGGVSDELVSMVDLAPTVLALAGIERPLHFQGNIFLGAEKRQRDHIFATRDRYDEAYDMMRAVRSARFKYIQNFYPQLPYHVWVRYLHRHPAHQELLRGFAEGTLTDAQQIHFGERRPVEELYDCEADPFELVNLAGDARHHATLAQLRAALEEWRRTFGDMGEVPEAQMVQAMWPGGRQPVTAAPLFIPLGPGHVGVAPAEQDASYEGPLDVMLFCGTQGASIAYTLEDGDGAHWKLYTAPLRLAAGLSVVRAKAIRIGFQESEERAMRFTVD